MSLPKPVVLKDVLLIVEGTDYSGHVSEVVFTPSVPVVRWRGLSPSAEHVENGSESWTVSMSMAQDWSATGLSRYLFDHAGQEATVRFKPQRGKSTSVTATVVLSHAGIGGAVDSFATQQVSLPVRGRPRLSGAAGAEYVELPAEIISNFQPFHGWYYGGTAGAFEDDTTTFIKGTQSLRVKTQSGVLDIKRLGLPPIDLTNKAIRVTARMRNPQSLSNLVFQIGTDDLANTFRFRANPRNNASPTQQIGHSNEWFQFTLSWADVFEVKGTKYSLDAFGHPSATSGFTDMEFEISHNANGPLEIWFQSIEVVPAPKAAYPNGIVSIGWDDGWASSWDGFLAMQARGMVGTHYIIGDNVDTPGRLSLAQYKEMQSEGWEIAGHAWSQVRHDNRLISYTAAEVRDEMERLRDFMGEHGFDGPSFAYPGGEDGFTTDGVLVKDIVAEYFDNGRTILAYTGVPKHLVTDILPPAMPYRIRGLSAITESDPANWASNPNWIVAQDGVLSRVAYAGSYLNIVLHRTSQAPSTDIMFIGMDALEMILDDIQARGMAVKPAVDVLSPYMI